MPVKKKTTKKKTTKRGKKPAKSKTSISGKYGNKKQKIGKNASPKSKKNDKKVLAKAVGWRKSKTGKVYWENRENRSDKNKKTKL